MVNLAGPGLGFLLFAQALVDGFLDSVQHIGLFRGFGAGAFEGVAGFAELLIDCPEFSVHGFTAFLCAGNFLLGGGVFLIQFAHARFVELNAVFVPLHF